MQIYIEDFLLQNFLTYFCLLRLVYLTTKTETNVKRLMLSALVGAGFSILTAMYLPSTILATILHFICNTIALLLAFKASPKQYIYNLITFNILYFAFVGAVNCFGTSKFYTPSGLVAINNLNLNFLTTFVIVATYICELALKAFQNKIHASQFVYKITLSNKKNQITTQAYLDSGNLLTHNGKQVIIVDLNTFLKLKNINLIDFYLMEGEHISLATASGQTKLKLFIIDEVKIHVNNKTITIKNQYLAINTNNMFKTANYHALLPCGII